MNHRTTSSSRIYLFADLKEEEETEELIEEIEATISDSLKIINPCIREFQQALSTRTGKMTLRPNIIKLFIATEIEKIFTPVTEKKKKKKDIA